MTTQGERAISGPVPRLSPEANVASANSTASTGVASLANPPFHKKKPARIILAGWMVAVGFCQPFLPTISPARLWRAIRFKHFRAAIPQPRHITRV
jgi:hypothetical protein